MAGKYLFRSLRPDQWVKNFFIFLPLIFGKKLFVFPINLKIIVAFCSFSLASSVVYLINDITDIKKDKLYPVKHLRAIASGKVSIKQAKITALILIILSIAFSFTLSAYFRYIIITYIACNIAYSKILKNIVIIDVFCLGGFFLLRILAGSIVAEVVMSHWILIMTTLLALFLGFTKRHQEIKLLKQKAPHHLHLFTKYNIHFIDQMITVVASSTAVAYMLYTVDARTVVEFGTKNLMYSIPFVYYGIFRYLYLISNTCKGNDPTSVLLSDRTLQITIVLWIGVCIAVIYFGL